MERELKLVIFFTLILAIIVLTFLVTPNPISNGSQVSDSGYSVHLQLSVALLQGDDSAEEALFNITKGNSIQLKAVISSLSSDKKFTLPLNLSVKAFENQPLTDIITSPSSTDPALPNHEYSFAIAKPFEASFDPNPLILEPKESKTVTLKVTALEDAQVGQYTMFIELGNWEKTALSALTFELKVLPKQ